MKNTRVPGIWILLFSLFFSSCEIVGDIFKAGMGFGIFLVVLVVGGIVALIMRAGKK